jgi:hypothetical protein
MILINFILNRSARIIFGIVVFRKILLLTMNIFPFLLIFEIRTTNLVLFLTTIKNNTIIYLSPTLLKLVFLIFFNLFGFIKSLLVYRIFYFSWSLFFGLSKICLWFFFTKGKYLLQYRKFLDLFLLFKMHLLF